MELTNEDVADILALLDSLPYDELDLQTPRFRLTLRRAPGGWTQSTQVLAAPERLATEGRPTAAEAEVVGEAGEDGDEDEGLVAVRAPLPGTFYRAPRLAAAKGLPSGRPEPVRRGVHPAPAGRRRADHAPAAAGRTRARRPVRRGDRGGDRGQGRTRLPDHGHAVPADGDGAGAGQRAGWLALRDGAGPGDQGTCGSFGKPTAPVEPWVLDTIMDRPRAWELAAELLPPPVAELRLRFCPDGISDEELLLRFACLGGGRRHAGRLAAARHYTPEVQPVLRLLRELGRRPPVSRLARVPAAGRGDADAGQQRGPGPAPGRPSAGHAAGRARAGRAAAIGGLGRRGSSGRRGGDADAG